MWVFSHYLQYVVGTTYHILNIIQLLCPRLLFPSDSQALNKILNMWVEHKILSDESLGNDIVEKSGDVLLLEEIFCVHQQKKI